MPSLEDSSKATIMPHIRIPRLLKDGGRVGGDAILEDVQDRVEALIADTQGSPIHLSQKLSPGIVCDAPRSKLRPYGASRTVASRRDISLLSMPQLKFVRREAGGACAGCYMPYA